MRLHEIMKSNVETISSSESAATALARMKMRRIRHLVVTRGGEIIGVLSERDVRSVGPYRTIETVGDSMSKPVVTASPTTTLREAANLLRGRTIGCLPIVEKNRLVGIVTTTDLLEMIGRGMDRPTATTKRWVMKGRGPRRKPPA
jgi:acetoin utilization protein AcuB